MWGCFRPGVQNLRDEKVFPTHVGVFPKPFSAASTPSSLPHACGGVSAGFFKIDYTRSSSPRMWGCFRTERRRTIAAAVFPTHVGVFPPARPAVLRGRSLPHACGGVSNWSDYQLQKGQSSPRMWGCFFRLGLQGLRGKVFPTHVGVFPAPDCRDGDRRRLPHACGGVSSVIGVPDVV